jgi:hypothetical protein
MKLIDIAGRVAYFALGFVTATAVIFTVLA